MLACSPLRPSPAHPLVHPWQNKALTKEAADQRKAAEVAMAAATLARRQLAQAQRRLRQAQERAQVEAEAQARRRQGRAVRKRAQPEPAVVSAFRSQEEIRAEIMEQSQEMTAAECAEFARACLDPEFHFLI